MDILWLIHRTPLPFVPASLLLWAGSSLLPAAPRSLADWRTQRFRRGSVLCVCLSHPFSPTLSFSASLPESAKLKPTQYSILSLPLNPALETNASFLLLLESEKSFILSGYKLLCSIRRTQKDPDRIFFFFFSICLRSFLLSCLKLDGFREEVLFGLFLIAMLKSFLLML